MSTHMKELILMAKQMRLGASDRLISETRFVCKELSRQYPNCTYEEILDHTIHLIEIDSTQEEATISMLQFVGAK